MAFNYTYRADDITSWDADTRDLVENRDRELELYSTTIDTSFLNLNASNLTSGTVPSARMTGAYTGITGLGALTSLDVQTTTGTAVRITNTGTGNSFLVEDSASTDATPFVINAAGNVGIGVSSPSNALDVSGNVQITGGNFVVGGQGTFFNTNAEDGIILAGRIGGTGSYRVVFTPTTLSASRTVTLPNATGTMITTGNLSDITSVAATALTGIIASARLSGSYTGITGVGTLSAGSIPATLLTGIIASARLSGAYTGITQLGTISSSLTVTGGTGTTITATTQTLINGTNNNSAIYLGGSTGASSTGGIEASWRDAANPSIAIGVTRDNNRTMTVHSYADSTIRFYAGNSNEAYINNGGFSAGHYYGVVQYGSYGSLSVYGENGGWYGIVFPSQATTWMSAANGQYFGCYRNNTTWNFYVQNGTFVPSDERYKRDIEPLQYGMNLIRGIVPVTFDPLTESKDDDPETTVGRTHYGFTTQNILHALSNAGETRDVAVVDVGGPANESNESDRQYLNHSALMAPMVKAIQELDARLQQLENP